MNLKKGTPLFGLILGAVFAAVGALIMLIGFWKTLLLCVLFAAGFFIGAVGNKREFMKNAANRIIPDKEVKVIDLKSELKREQELSQSAVEANGEEEPKTKE